MNIYVESLKLISSTDQWCNLLTPEVHILKPASNADRVLTTRLLLQPEGRPEDEGLT